MSVAVSHRPARARRLATPRLMAALALFVLSATLFCAVVGYVLVRQAEDRQGLERRAALLGAIEDIRRSGADFSALDPRQILGMERTAGLKGLRFETEPDTDGATGERELQSVLDRNGRIAGWFSWQPDRSMSNALGRLKPLLALTAFLLVGFAGIAPHDGADPDSLLKNADMALYGAKSDGRATYRFFEPEMDARMKARRDLEMDLRKALANNEFELYYQRLVNLQDNRISALEALLRWHHPTRGMISPADLIPIAEETGLIVAIGEWVLNKACNETANWPDHVKVAVNVSPAQLKSRGFLKTVTDAIAESGMSAHKLQLEITETVLMQNTFATLETLHELRKLGVQIAMDDFGTGYSSLSYLRSFPFDKIKIDRSFIQDLANGAEPLAIVHAIAGLAKCLNITSTAEGVETQKQLETLQAIGCTEMQGYLFSRARPVSEVSQFFAKEAAEAASAA